MSSTVQYRNVIPHHYVVEEDQNKISYENKRLADDLTKYLINEYLDDMLYKKSPFDRIHAAKKLAKLGKNGPLVEIISNISKLEKNQNVRMECLRSIELLKKK